MSNTITNIKKKPLRIKRKQEQLEFDQTAREQAIQQASQSGGKGLSIITRPLPNTLYVNVHSGEMKVGEPDIPIAELPPNFVFSEKEPNFKELYEFLEGLTETEIHKVVLDANDHFKIQGFTEFIDRLRQTELDYLKKKELGDQLQPQSPEELNDTVAVATDYFESADTDGDDVA